MILRIPTLILVVVFLFSRPCFGTEVIAPEQQPFPRLMGMNIGKKHYDNPQYLQDLSRLNIVIMGFYRGWNPRHEAQPIRRVISRLRSLNSQVIVGQYTVLNEAYDDSNNMAMSDIRAKLTENDWWLRNQAGRKVQWTTAFGAWEVNLSDWVRPDAQGYRYPEWIAEREHEVFFQDRDVFGVWYVDNVMNRPRVVADWDRDGVNDRPDDARILAAHRNAYRIMWQRIRDVRPDILIIGNADGDLSEPEFRGELNGVFLEGMIGKTWSIERRLGWTEMMRRYRAVKQNLREPRIIGFNVWGDLKDYQTFRYAFASALMDDGYFSFTDERAGYSSVPWFDEYDVKLGRAISPPPTQPWQLGIYRRDFEHGSVLVNPTYVPIQVRLEPGLRRIAGKQDVRTNNGQPADRLEIRGRDGMVLVRVKHE